MDFTPSNPSWIGMEMEFQLLDVETLDLVDGILPLMDFYPNDPYIKPEFNQNTVEVCSKICNDMDDLGAHMRSLLRNLRDTCQRLDMLLCSAGTHPFGERLALITPMPRYRQLEKSAGYIGHNQITFATHVHLGMTSGDEATSLMHELKALLPLLIAVSANSPFWRGFDTGFAAYRHRILAATRSYGIPPSFETWDDFSNFLETTTRAGVFSTINDIHWDIRPRPHLGTLEIRVMDAQPTITLALTLAGFLRALVTYLRTTPQTRRPPLFPQALHWWIEKHNHFQASKQGLEAKYIHDVQGTLVPMRELCQHVMQATEPIADELGQGPYFGRLQDHVHDGPSYVHQRKVYEKTGSFKAIARHLIVELEMDLNGAS
jgi:carboxylate-amine ligase